MTDPITTPGERTRRELQAIEDSRDERTFREKMLVSQVRTELAIEAMVVSNASLARSLDDHKADDKAEFLEVKAMIREEQNRVASISSSVTEGKMESRYTIKEVIVGFLVLCGALGALIGFIGWYFTNGPKTP